MAKSSAVNSHQKNEKEHLILKEKLWEIWSENSGKSRIYNLTLNLSLIKRVKNLLFTSENFDDELLKIMIRVKKMCLTSGACTST